MAGPMTRAPFMTMLFRLTALGRSLLPTISMTKVWRAGLSNMFTTPSTSDEQVHLPQMGVPRLAVAQEHEEPEHERQPTGRSLRDDQQAPLVDPIGDEPAPRAEEAAWGGTAGPR